MPIGTPIGTWNGRAQSLRQRFRVLNKEKIARDKLQKWRQFKDVSSFNEEFLSIILNTENTSMDEQIDRYTRGLKHTIWREICTKEYKTIV